MTEGKIYSPVGKFAERAKNWLYFTAQRVMTMLQNNIYIYGGNDEVV